MGLFIESEIRIMENCRIVMRDVFGMFAFKSDYQYQAFKSIIRGDRAVIVSMKSYGGKSFCYQLAGALNSANVTAVISPSLALIHNQMQFLNGLGLKAVCMTSDQSHSERAAVTADLQSQHPEAKFLFFTPEMMFKVGDGIIEHLVRNAKLTRIIVDGSVTNVDFREDLLRLGKFKEKYFEIQWVFLTTKPESVLTEIALQLNMENPTVIRGPSTRDDTFYRVRSAGDQMGALNCILDDLQALAKKSGVPSGIIFTNKDDETKPIASFLISNGIEARSYSASKENRFKDQDAWMRREFPVLVATGESFGYGIVAVPTKFVYHFGRPRTFNAFYQESGRAYGLKLTVVQSCIYDLGESGDANVNKYMETKECRRSFIGDYFNETVPACGYMCDNCDVKT